MHQRILCVLVIGAAASVAACASNPPATAKAAGVERVQCDGSATTQRETELLRTVTVLHFQPIYSHVASANNNSEERVNGAKITIRPPKGVGAEEMTRILQCHSARVLLGRVGGNDVANDPYWLPDTWMNIEVKPEDGNFAVTISADSIRENLEMLGRAHRYADDHMLATDPGLP